MKAQNGSNELFYSFFNLGARWAWVFNATPRPLYPRKEARYPFYSWLGGPQGRYGRVRKTGHIKIITLKSCDNKSSDVARTLEKKKKTSREENFEWYKRWKCPTVVPHAATNRLFWPPERPALYRQHSRSVSVYLRPTQPPSFANSLLGCLVALLFVSRPFCFLDQLRS
jgi:hypothetical protein